MSKTKKVLALAGVLMFIPACAVLSPLAQAVAPSAEANAAGLGVSVDIAALLGAACVEEDSPVATSLREWVPWGLGDVVVNLTLPLCPADSE